MRAHQHVLSLLVVAFGFFFSQHSSASAAERTVDFVIFNVRWFGAQFENPRSIVLKPITREKQRERLVVMKHFMLNVVKPKDVVQFEEVVDVRLLKKILPPGWTCATYENANLSHQHVATCASPEFQLLKVPYDDNMAIEGVAGAKDPAWSRPALRLDLADQAGHRLLRMVGLHLKAMPFYSFERARQMRVIADDLKNDLDIPIVVAGDLNTYEMSQTKRESSDADFLAWTLKQADASFELVRHKKQYTYRSPRYRSQFDQILVNGRVRANIAETFAVCNRVRDGVGYLNFQYYYDYVSDHCPVRSQLHLK